MVTHHGEWGRNSGEEAGSIMSDLGAFSMHDFWSVDYFCAVVSTDSVVSETDAEDRNLGGCGGGCVCVVV